MSKIAAHRPPWWAVLVLCGLSAFALFLAIFFWTRGWPFPALLVAALGLFAGWAWFDNRFIYIGRRRVGDSAWRGPAPHEGWAEGQADRDAWLGGGGGG